MPMPSQALSVSGVLLWLLLVGVVAFGVSELGATVLRASRTAYVGVLTAVTAALSFGYLAWADVSLGDVLSARWAWGLLAAPFAAAVMVLGMRRLPSAQRRTGSGLGFALVWEGGVYGVAEGVLLSVLPALMTWHLVDALDWSGAAGGVARWTLPVAASVAVVVVHHLGYPQYRNRMLVPISVGCGLLTVGFLVTGSVLAAAGGHVLGHASALLHGTELPPHRTRAARLPQQRSPRGRRALVGAGRG